MEGGAEQNQAKQGERKKTLDEEFSEMEMTLKSNYGMCMLKGSWRYTLIGVIAGLPIGAKLKQPVAPVIGGLVGSFADHFASRSACDMHRVAMERFYQTRAQLENEGKLRRKGEPINAPLTPAPGYGGGEESQSDAVEEVPSMKESDFYSPQQAEAAPEETLTDKWEK
uniref:Uncharacterized protein n=1 Tax=Palpitomonas bilix TaxID=652834 RepID=A0A7S3GM08_9EUKA|mmetsp:Transcript_9299/g.25298  ORF Transcript_9299/g.25298 Transcript_9299/m.25298 type:complete len:168 (+) Transcript_9299:77-580(+)